MTTVQNIKFALCGALLAGLAACGGGGGGTAATTDSGSLRLALIDAPACGYDAVNITVEKVRVHQSASAADADGGWSEVVLSPARRINLLNLTNGVLDELGQTPLPAGKYTQLRMVLADNTGTNPFANSVKPTGLAEAAMKTPSGQQSGVKANINIDVAANKLADFVIDFDACKSVVTAGNSGQYLLKPVITVVPRYISGVTGFVDATLAGGSSVSLQQGGIVIKATAPDKTGKFTLQPVAPGSYALVLTAPGRTTAVVTSVTVTADTVLGFNALGTALNPPASASATFNGTAPANTLVRAVQLFAGGVEVEVAGRFVDGTTGAYSYVLPVNAPLVAPYAAAPVALVFTPDAAAAGKYTLKASLPTFADKTATPPAPASGATVTTNFTFP